jgi:hypothetical protein
MQNSPKRPRESRGILVVIACFLIVFTAALWFTRPVLAGRTKNFTVSNAGEGTAITVTSARAVKVVIKEDPTTCANDYQVKMPSTAADPIKKVACTSLVVEGYFQAGDTVAYVKSLGRMA